MVSVNVGIVVLVSYLVSLFLAKQMLFIYALITDLLLQLFYFEFSCNPFMYGHISY